MSAVPTGKHLPPPSLLLAASLSHHHQHLAERLTGRWGGEPQSGQKGRRRPALTGGGWHKEAGGELTRSKHLTWLIWGCIWLTLVGPELEKGGLIGSCSHWPSCAGSGLVVSEAVGQSSVVIYDLVIIVASLMPEYSSFLLSLEIHSPFQSETSVTIQMPPLLRISAGSLPPPPSECPLLCIVWHHSILLPIGVKRTLIAAVYWMCTARPFCALQTLCTWKLVLNHGRLLCPHLQKDTPPHTWQWLVDWVGLTPLSSGLSSNSPLLEMHSY